MNLVPTQVNKPLVRLRDQIHNLVDRWIPTFWDGGKVPAEWNFPQQTFLQGPSVNMRETENELIVEAAMPGLEKDDFHVDISKNRLFLSGEKKQQKETKGKNRYRYESSFGSFKRVIPLPNEVETEKVEADYKHGVLTVNLPKTEKAKKRQIAIKVN